MHKLAYQDAPRENLQTWGMLCKLLSFGTGAAAVFLLLLAFFMT